MRCGVNASKIVIACCATAKSIGKILTVTITKQLTDGTKLPLINSFLQKHKLGL
jgi:hypothetical protein